VNRRQILQILGAVAIGSAASKSFASHRALQEAGVPFSVKQGAQTNARAIDPADFETFLTVLEQIKRAGFAGFEIGYFNLVHEFDVPGNARQSIEPTGLQFAGIHVAIDFDKTDPTTKLPPASLEENVARGGIERGAQRMIFSGAPAANEEELKRKIDGLNAAGQFAHSIGIPFSCHNRWWEVQSKVYELESPYAQTDPGEVSFILDAGHAISSCPRCACIHSQVWFAYRSPASEGFEDGKPVLLGEGCLPLKKTIAALETVHWNGWLINEEDRADESRVGTAVIERAYHALQEVLPIQTYAR
jgi:inosose dehydratase